MNSGEYDLIGKLLRNDLHIELIKAGNSIRPAGYCTDFMNRPYMLVSLIRTGVSRLELKEEPGTIIRRQGDVCVLDSGTWRRSTVISRSDAEYSFANIRITLPHNIKLGQIFNMPKLFSGATAATLTEKLEKIIKLEEKGPELNFSDLLRQKQLLFSMLEIIVKNSPVKENLKALIKGSGALDAAIDHIHRHFRETLKIEELASIACMCVSHFHRRFKETSGKSPLEYIIALRLQHAQELILFSDMNINEISERCGFKDQLYFSRCFRRNFDISPMQYRKGSNIE